MYKSFPGKIILFGEYSIITGSWALVIPLRLYSGKLNIPEGKAQVPDRSNKELLGFLNFLACRQDKEKLSQKIDISRLGEDLDRGLNFRSTIPSQYGAGSSAALVAADYDAYALNKIPEETATPSGLAELKILFGEMESHFHGTSSGIDPLCSYTGNNILIEPGGIRSVPVSLPDENAGLYLLDSGQRGDTRPLVSKFRSRLTGDADFARMIREDLSKLVERGINALTGYSDESLREIFLNLSVWQLENLVSMIPDDVKKIWETGLNTGVYSMKLCGSGGGGFFLAYAEDKAGAEPIFRKTGINFLSLDL